jgi:SAM-dependent methyltransferase
MRRLPFRPGFDAVLSFFTSFGYFEDPKDDHLVLQEIARVLRPRGRFLLDFLNRDRVIAGLVPESSAEREGFRIEERRTLVRGGERVEKTVRLIGLSGGGAVLEYKESVRLYARAELESLLERAGLEPERALGGFHGRPFDASSERLVLIATKR